MSLDSDNIFGAALQAYEERFLFMLFLLRQPNLRLIYVTAQAIQPATIDYYLQLLPGLSISNARKRLFLVSPLDGSARTLTQKLLARPRLIQHIRSLIPDLNRAHLVPYNTTDPEKQLAIRLGIPMYAADPDFFAFGTKSGSRRMFAEEGVPHPLGVENLRSVEELVTAIVQMRSSRKSQRSEPQGRDIRRVIVKLNEGVSGEGNAVVKLEALPPPGDPQERAGIVERLHSMRFELAGITFDWYVHKLAERGGIVEEMIEGEDFRSPSTQLRVTPLGLVEQLSTHDQMLGGPGGQTYLGCRFPANTEYAPAIMREAAKIGRRFAKEGIVGRFAIDFVVVRGKDGAWQPYAIEINLRKGGTTHPFLTLQYLTDGAYDAERALFTTERGHEKCYVATDHLHSEAYRAFTADDLFDIVSRHRLHFDHTSQTGIVLHMVSGVGDLGQLGFTAIAGAHESANALYERMIEVLDAEARSALQ
ncbi:MAG TPA: peptide ligase PGM1-related protein [Candidatus Eremiobacteraceae bacterium]|nr:peptide ligase PGM1-related protein [Candidatus Eremiobacteraceae bacterium]